MFRPHVSPAGKAYYNNILHGLIRFREIRHLWPRDREKLSAILCTEIGTLLVMLMRGSFVIIPELLFHKKTRGAYADLHPHDELAGYYNSLIYRTKSVFRRLPHLLKARREGQPVLTIVLLWALLFYPYTAMTLAKKLKQKLKA